jgi:SNF2 family DNA or RNA helicase
MVREHAPPQPARLVARDEKENTSPFKSNSQASQIGFSLEDDWFEDGFSPSPKVTHSQPTLPTSLSPTRGADALLDRFKKLQVGSGEGSASQPNPETRGLASADSSVVEIPRPHHLQGQIKEHVKDAVHRPNPFHAHQGRGGGHGQLISSRKQKAGGFSNVFVHQTSRPEHHITKPNNHYKISAPTNPSFQDPSPQTRLFFSSMGNLDQLSTGFGEPDFYVDPAKAAADLKALLEGGVEDEEEEKVKEQDGTVEGLNVKLLPHQVEGVEWMKGRELGPVKRGRVPKGGILADDMGLGKTLQTITLILQNQRPGKDAEGWKKTYNGVEKTTLVVAPLALIRQWEAEIKEKVTKDRRLKVCVHHGPNRTRSWKELALYDVVITTYQTLVSEHGASNMSDGGNKVGCFGVSWWRVVLDEAHSIKNKSAKATKACCALNSIFRWCLTGTPMQNKLEELQSLINFLRIPPYNNLREFKEHIEKPLNGGQGDIAIRRLHSVLRCFMKRRTKDILKAEGALNPGGKPSKPGEGSTTGFKVVERKVIAIQAEFSPAEQRFYSRLESRTDQSIERMLKGKVNYANALVLLLRLRQSCNHPKLVEGKLEKDKDALTTDPNQPKNSQTSVDDLADMLAGASIQTRSCDICGRELLGKDFENGRDQCQACFEDLAYFNAHETPQAKKSKKVKVKVKSKKELVVKGKKVDKSRRGRKIVVDSDDEEGDGSWLVPEDQRGGLKLGKAGGQDDEDAEGGGDWIGDEDSKHESEDESRSQLDSFIVPDNQVKEQPKPGDYPEDSDDEFPSLHALCSQPKKEQSVVEEDSETETDSEEDSTDDDSISASEVDDSDDSDGSLAIYNIERKYKKSSAPPILASAKIRRLIKILQNEVQEHKFIVFSEFTSMLDLVEPFFRKEGFKFTRYDGSMKNDEREASLNRLRNDANVRVLLCSLKCGSLGLNLTAATRVVILEPFWNPVSIPRLWKTAPKSRGIMWSSILTLPQFIEEQAIDRVHRLTQKIDVVVYKLTIAGTVEERILALQDRKRHLADQAIEGSMKKDGLKLGIKEMLALFRRPGGTDYVSQWEDGAGRGGNVEVPGGTRVLPSLAGSGRSTRELSVEKDGEDDEDVVVRRRGGKETKRKDDGGIYGRRW